MPGNFPSRPPSDVARVAKVYSEYDLGSRVRGEVRHASEVWHGQQTSAEPCRNRVSRSARLAAYLYSRSDSQKSRLMSSHRPTRHRMMAAMVKREQCRFTAASFRAVSAAVDSGGYTYFVSKLTFRS